MAVDCAVPMAVVEEALRFERRSAARRGSRADALHRPRPVVADDTPDMDWIDELGRRGLVVLTRDEEISRRPNELAAGRRSGRTVRGRVAGLATRCHATSRTRHLLDYLRRAGGVAEGLSVKPRLPALGRAAAVRRIADPNMRPGGLAASTTASLSCGL